MNFATNIAETYNYDAWGRRRNPVTWTYNNVPEPTLIDFGFTSHEHWDEVNLINMTGRLYDPYQARVLNPDPYVSDPNSSQALNRYTYAMNNPFIYSDPDGESIELLAVGIVIAFSYLKAAHDGRNENGKWDWKLKGTREENGNLGVISYFLFQGTLNFNGGFNIEGSVNVNGIPVVGVSYKPENTGIPKREHELAKMVYEGEHGIDAASHGNSQDEGLPFVYQSDRGKYFSVVNAAAAAGPVGGLFDIGVVADNYGQSSIYFTMGYAYGFGATAGIGFGETTKDFHLQDYWGLSSGASLTIPFTPIGVEGACNLTYDDNYGTKYRAGGTNVGVGAAWINYISFTILVPNPPRDFWLTPGSKR